MMVIDCRGANGSFRWLWVVLAGVVAGLFIKHLYGG